MATRLKIVDQPTNTEAVPQPDQADDDYPIESAECIDGRLGEMS